MKIGEVAKLSGVSIRTVDYYTNCGLLAVERSQANYRLYPDTVLHTLDRIQLLKKQRMSIAEIQEVLKASDMGEAEELIEDVIEEFNCLQRKITYLEEQLKDAPAHVKLQISKTLENKMVAIATLLALL
ncbi:MerR family transcriptional regulator [Planococcus sp. N028]|uniref:MerR family transcriptional regulator n=1 Tax=Planococcus shixiaomingii TaxID=3058393 RepID=A0ABT8N2P4_9BACL|nr:MULTISPECIES: MerR family transcriptional regulator [unclassified Planococcus (in: firmicutes)]MDN7242159.1 MerR family transcriptional regulator [Planococcus sp. N028]WKA54432.1 MerR family transcriptional regulator [Planococcus sp. N022]